MADAVVVDRASFDDLVLAGSHACPVLVDFWAPWCAPCRSLAPVLEKLAREFAHRMTLAKLDTDQEPEIAARYGVRGIPNCKLFVDGEVVDEFTGALPEQALRQWLEDALPSQAKAIVAAAADCLRDGNPQAAIARLAEAAKIDPDDEALLLTRAEALLAIDRADLAQETLESLESPPRSRARPVRDERRFAALKARAALGNVRPEDLPVLARAASALPVDCAAKLAYARALAANGDYEPALAELLAVVNADRAFGDDAGRRTMLTIFEALGNDSDLVRRYRRELASALNR